MTKKLAPPGLGKHPEMIVFPFIVYLFPVNKKGNFRVRHISVFFPSWLWCHSRHLLVRCYWQLFVPAVTEAGLVALGGTCWPDLSHCARTLCNADLENFVLELVLSECADLGLREAEPGNKC